MNNDSKFTKVADENGINIEFECNEVEDFMRFFNDLYKDLLKFTSSKSTTIKFILHGDNTLKELYMKKQVMTSDDDSIILSDSEIDELVDELL